MLPFDQFALIADCGIGKTYIMLNIIEQKQYKKILIVCPKAVMNTAWADDIPKFTDFSYSLVWDIKMSKRINMLGDQKIHVINYDVINTLYTELLKQNYDCIILDESTFIKTNSSKRTKSCLRLVRHIKHRYIMTATLGKNIEKYWSQFYFIDPRTWDGLNFYQFREKYFYKIDANGLPLYFFNKRYIPEINERIYRKGMRILKEEVQKYLPDRNFIVRLLDMPDVAMKKYKTFHKDGVVDNIYSFFSISQRQKLLQMANGNVINDQLGKEREIINLHNTKLNEVKRIIEDDIDEDDQILIWSCFTEDIELLHNITGYPKVCGGVNYMKSLIDFKEGKIKGIIAHPKSIGHGVTLVKCSNVIYYGLSDDLEAFQQSLDRCHRHGQTKNVNYFLLLCRGTIDEDVLNEHRKNKALENELTNQKKKISVSNLVSMGLI
jgi:SNF2 family DNA or RNA helicase